MSTYVNSRRVVLLAIVALFLAAMACGGDEVSPTAEPTSAPTVPVQPSATPGAPVPITDRTIFGFFPSPSRLTDESFVATLQAMGEHGDVALVQVQLPWAEFVDGPDGDSPSIAEMRNILASVGQRGLEAIFVLDPLQAFDRRVIATFPPELAGGDFGTPAVRQTFKNYALRIVREFHPRYLGLASEINTYAGANPEDFANYVSLYHEVYQAVKAESPETQMFVTFQWEDLNNVGPFAEEGVEGINWETIEVFEPEMDVWAISTYPYFAFESAEDIPPDYYTPLLSRTSKPLAIGEGGYLSADVGESHGSPEDQIGYLRAINTQIRERLVFWVYLVIDDVDVEAYAEYLTEHGSPASVELVALFGVLGLRTMDGEPKPALAFWDSLRGE